MKQLALIFPGIGYTIEKPLLSGSIRIASRLGYEIRPVFYTGFPEKIRGDSRKMEASFQIACKQALEILSGIDFSIYDDVLMVGKSIGTVAAAFVADRYSTPAHFRYVLYTPLEETFSFSLGEAIVFTGTSDPWVGAEGSRIPELCRRNGIPCYSVSGANHSLITGDARTDSRNLEHVMQQTEQFVLSSQKGRRF